MKGILFTEPNFIATIEGFKIDTRRIINSIYDTRIQTEFYWKEVQLLAYGINSFGFFLKDKLLETIKPRYKEGEIVFIKEPYRIKENNLEHFVIELKYSKCDLFFLCDAIKNSEGWIKKRLKEQEKSKSGFCNKMFMPSFCARYFIDITNVRCEHLQYISDEDCFREGIIEERPEFYDLGTEDGKPAYGYPEIIINGSVYSTKWFNTPREAYAAEIDAINGKGTWDSNPYVWVYSYKLAQ